MFIVIILSITLGLTAGIFTGLTPGVHINLISLLLISLSPKLTFIPPIAFVIFIISLSITHTFLDAIPGVYLGAPDESQALSVLPGHKYLLQGKGHVAIILTLIGSFFSLLLAIILVPLFIFLFNKLYIYIKPWISWILIFIMIYMIFKDKNYKYNLIIFLFAGLLGLITLNIPNQDQVLLPLLSGLFGISILLISLKDNTSIPLQNLDNKLDIPFKKFTKAIFGSTLVASIASFLPGFGSSQSAIVAQQILGDIGDDGFLIVVGGINTVNMALSLITLYTIQKARNGAIVAISQIFGNINLQTLILIFLSIIITSSIALILGLKISKLFSKLISKINYKLLIITIISFVTLLVIIFSQITGFIILITATALGILSTNLGVGKNHLMGCLIIPVIIYLF